MKINLFIVVSVVVMCFFWVTDSEAVYVATDGVISQATVNDQLSNVSTVIAGSVNIQDMGGGGNFAGGNVSIIDDLGHSVCSAQFVGNPFFSCTVGENLFGRTVKIGNGVVVTNNVPPSGNPMYRNFGALGTPRAVEDRTPPTLSLTSVQPTSIDVTQSAGGVDVFVDCVDYGSGCIVQSIYLTMPSGDRITNGNQQHFIIPQGAELGEWKVGVMARNGAGSNVSNSYLGTFTVLDNSGPKRKNLSPSNDVELKDNAGTAELSLTTDEKSECHYSADKEKSFDEMKSFDKTDAKEHNSKIHVDVEKQYKFYVKCRDEGGNVNNSNEIIAFKTVKDYEKKNVTVEKPKLTLRGKLKKLKLSKHAKVYSEQREVKFGGQVDKELIGGQVIVKGKRGSHKIKDKAEVDADGNWKEKVKFDKNGTWKVKFEFYDKYGDKVDTVGSYKITIDNDNPEFVDLKDKYIVKAGDPITLAAYDDYKLKKFKVYFRGQKYKIKPPHHKRKSVTSVVFVIPTNTVAGMYDMEVRAYDKSGNKAMRHVQVIVQ